MIVRRLPHVFVFHQLSVRLYVESDWSITCVVALAASTKLARACWYGRTISSIVAATASAKLARACWDQSEGRGSNVAIVATTIVVVIATTRGVAVVASATHKSLCVFLVVGGLVAISACLVAIVVDALAD